MSTPSVPDHWPELWWIQAFMSESLNIHNPEYHDLMLINPRSNPAQSMDLWTCEMLLDAMEVARTKTFNTFPPLIRIAQPGTVATGANYNTTVQARSWTQPASPWNVVPTIANALTPNRAVFGYSTSGIHRDLFAANNDANNADDDTTDDSGPSAKRAKIDESGSTSGGLQLAIQASGKPPRGQLAHPFGTVSATLATQPPVLTTTLIRVTVHSPYEAGVPNRMIQVTVNNTDTIFDLKTAIIHAYQQIYAGGAFTIPYIQFAKISNEYYSRIYEYEPSTTNVNFNYVTVQDCFPMLNGTAYIGGDLSFNTHDFSYNFYRNQIFVERDTTPQ